jgi:DNA repair exonuclease SbcCD ATPase subunit
MGIFESARQLASLASQVHNLEIHEKAVELMGQVSELSHELSEAKRRVKELEDQLERKEKLIFHENFYWYGTKTPNQFHATDGPFCSACFDTTGKLVRIHTREIMSGVEVQVCPACDLKKK